jgi:hypothetical protein
VDEPKALIKGPDGAVFGAWQCWYTRHLGAQYDKFGGISGITNRIGICADSKGDNWLLWDNPADFFAPGANVKLLFKSEFNARNQCRVHVSLSHFTMARTGMGKSSPFSVIKDPLGRFWFFDTEYAWRIMGDQMRPVVIFDPAYAPERALPKDDEKWCELLNAMVYDGTAAFYQMGSNLGYKNASLMELPRHSHPMGTQLVFLTPKDEHTLWAGFVVDGLYEIDMTT